MKSGYTPRKAGLFSHSKHGATGLPSLLWVMVVMCPLTPAIAEVTDQDIRDAILGTRAFTQEELNAMDEMGNRDGQVDVADLIFLLNPESETERSVISVQESNSTINVTFYLPSVYTGTVKYAVTDASTATSELDYEPLSGSVSVNGSSLTIPVTLKDDVLIEDIETLIIKLETSPEDLLTVGPSQERTLYIQDNDATWKGSLAVSNLSVGFELVLLQAGNTCSAKMQSDGVGGIPAGTWPAVVESTADSFKCTLGPIDVAKDLTLFDAAMKRTILLESNPAEKQTDVLDYNNFILGRLTESVAVSDGKSHLSLTGQKKISGTFTLVKVISMLPEGESEGETEGESEPAAKNN